MTKRQILGLSIAAILVWIMIHRVDRAALAQSLLEVHWAALMLAMSLKVLSVFVKSWRWGVAIEAGSGERIRNRLFSATLLGLAGNIVLPARLGEVARLRLLARHNDVPMGFMASGAGVAYLLDAAVLSMSLIALCGMSTGPQTVSRAAIAALVVFGILILLVGVSDRVNKVNWQRPLAFATRFLSENRTAQIFNQSRGLLRGFAALQQRAYLPKLLAYTVIILTLEIAAVHIGLTAFGIGNSLLAAAALVVALQMTYAMPVTPGNIGTHQVMCVLTLGAFGVGQPDALGFSLAFQGVAHTTILSLAGVVLFCESFDTTSLRPVRTKHPTSA